MKKRCYYLVLGVFLLIFTNETLIAQEFPIAVGSDTTYSNGAVYGGLNGLVAVQGNVGSKYSINAQLVGSGGILIGSRISLGATGIMPGAKPVFDGTNYFLVWCEFSGTLKGQFINTSGSLVGNAITISTSVSVERPGLYDVIFGETSYCVIYVKSNGYLYGQQVSKSGTLIGNQIQISTNFARDISSAYDGTNFLTAWVESIQGRSKDIFGQFISKTGSLVGNNFSIDGGANFSDNPTSLAFDGTRYLLAFHEAQTIYSDWFLLGRFISKSGVIEETITLCDISKAPSFPSIAFDNNNYLITWSQRSDKTLMGEFFNKSGVPINTPFVIFSPLENKAPIGGVGFGGGQYLAIGTKINSIFTDGDVYGRFIPSSSTGIDDIKLKNEFFNLFPNPASNRVNLSVNKPYDADITMNIYNVIGKLIRTEILIQNQQQINIEDLSNGIFMVEIKSKEWTENQKLLIQR